MNDWTGNVLSTAGTSLAHGEIVVELMRASPGIFGAAATAMPNEINVARPVLSRGFWTRTWVVTISRKSQMMIEPVCLSSLILLDMSPTQAKEEAEQVAKWAAAYYEEESPHAD